jgi:Predicted membrane protein
MGALPLTAETMTLLVPALMAALVLSMLYVLDPSLDRRIVLALTPWMVVGGAVHTLYTAGAYPASFSLRPFFGPVTVYFTTVVAAGLVWAMMSTAAQLAESDSRDAQYITSAGVGAALSTLAIVLSRADNAEAIVPVFAGLVVVVAVVMAVAATVDRPRFRDHARVGHAVLGAVAAVGLGPGVHRFLSLVVV